MRFFLPLVSFICLSLITRLQGQDPHYSQYFATPFQLNPALTGVFNGKMRVSAQYREQWKSFLGQDAFKTYSVGADWRLPVGKKDHFALGMKTLRDVAGSGNYAQSTAHFTSSFVKQLAGGNFRASHYLVAGGDIGFGQNSVNWSNLWFSRQFNSSSQLPDLTLPSQEQNVGDNATWLDGSAGLLWYAVYEEEGFIYAGGSLHHINKPVISLMGVAKETLYQRWSAHAGGLVPITETFGIAPSVWVTQQGPAFMANLGTNIRYTNHDQNELTLRAGAFARLVNKLESNTQLDAIVVVGMVEVGKWQIGLSYDINASSLKQASQARGAFEITAQYIQPDSGRRSKVKCPKL